MSLPHNVSAQLEAYDDSHRRLTVLGLFDMARKERKRKNSLHEMPKWMGLEIADVRFVSKVVKCNEKVDIIANAAQNDREVAYANAPTMAMPAAPSRT
jgi:hypothetical protein